MANFYFTYGTDRAFPFQGGYTQVVAADLHKAIELFRKHHPNRPGSNCINCAFYYTENEWKNTSMAYIIDYPCHEIIENENVSYPEYIKLGSFKVWAEMTDEELQYCKDIEAAIYLPKITELLEQGKTKGEIMAYMYILYQNYLIIDDDDILLRTDWGKEAMNNNVIIEEMYDIYNTADDEEIIKRYFS